MGKTMVDFGQLLLQFGHTLVHYALDVVYLGLCKAASVFNFRLGFGTCIG
jgi:hypothetical protein